MLDRQEITDAWVKRFNGLNQGYWITLNSKIRVAGHDDPRTPGKFIECGAMVEKFIGHINEYCYGRKFLRGTPGAKLTCLVAYEVGAVDGLVHCHILAAHGGSTNRTVNDLIKVATFKWSTICSTGGSKQFVDVDDIGSIKDRIWYMTKQTNSHYRLFRDFNITLH